MESEDKIERRSRSLSAAADDAALAVPVGALVTCRSLRAVRCRAAPQVKIVRALHDVCGPELRRGDSAFRFRYTTVVKARINI